MLLVDLGFSLDGGKDLQQSPPGRGSSVLFVFCPAVLPVLLLGFGGPWSRGGSDFGRVGRARRGVKDEWPTHLLPDCMRRVWWENGCHS